MGVIQIRHITKSLQKHFDTMIDMSDYAKKPTSEKDSAFLSRALAAYGLVIAADLDTSIAANAIVDEFGDNGIDAIHYSEKETTLYVVQSKWHAAGGGTISLGDMHKFIQGVRNLIDGEFARFGGKLRAKEALISNALDSETFRMVLLVAHTGLGPLGAEVKQVYDDLAKDCNDSSEIVSLRVLTQKEIHDAVSDMAMAQSIKLEVMLSEWGTTRHPYHAYYGQVAAADVAGWWDAYGTALFEKNLRKFVGSTEVNEAIVSTLIENPEKFWYFNNGITVMCTTLSKKAIGGNKRTSGIFVCDGVSIVNGAQTVGCIGEAFKKNPEQIAHARVSARFISVAHCTAEFPIQLTRAANTQNRIERKDFAALDPEQERLRRDLWMEYEKQYVFKTGDAPPAPDKGCGIDEATVALACANPLLPLAVQAKREVGKLWEDISRPPYKLLFNGTVTASRLWRSVEVLRSVESSIKKKQIRLSGRDRMVAVHGNRLILHCVFKELPTARFDDPSLDFGLVQMQAGRIASSVLRKVIKVVSADFPNAYLNSLFKNQSRCGEIVKSL